MFPPNPCRGHFLWDGSALWIWDGVGWQRVGPEAPGAAGIPEAPIDGNLYGRENAGWTIVPAPTPASRVSVSYYSSSASIIIPVGVVQCLVQMWGASGGSGGINANAASGATGAGGYLEKFLSGLTAGNTFNYVQGVGGTGGSSGAGSGGAGTVTTLSSGSQSIATLTCNASNGSTGATGTGGFGYTAGTPGGTASGGDFNLQGQAGAQYVLASPATPAGVEQIPGGATMMSRGADGVWLTVNSPGNSGNPGGLKIIWVTS
jgi:hypothetical protein